jgi:Xaa-Pro aminopeptidase
MFQSFDDASDTGATGERLARLRERLAALGLDGWLVPRADEYQGEYVAPGSERLRWLTGFTGSAGLAIILKSRAAVFADGRYTIQLAEQIDPDRCSRPATSSTIPRQMARGDASRAVRSSVTTPGSSPPNRRRASRRPAARPARS